MSKFKIGDKVRRINVPNCGIEVGTECIIKDINHWGWFKLAGYDSYGFGNNPDNFELVTPAPLTFEVGKSYKLNDGRLKNIYTVEFVSPITGTALATTESDGKTISARLLDAKRFSEVVPPPPEEWRALFYVKNGKPEVSALYGSSKSEVEAAWSDHEEFMYAIRTDINAKKEN